MLSKLNLRSKHHGFRYARNSAILAKIETTYGTDSTPSGSSNAILVSNISLTPLNANNVDRDLVRNYFGGSGQLRAPPCRVLVRCGNRRVWYCGDRNRLGPLLRACGFAETVTTYVSYSPISTSQESVTIYWYDDGTLYASRSVRGNVAIDLGLSNRPVWKYKFIGINGGVTAASVPSTTLTAFQKPLVITETNTGDILLGATYSAGSNTGGTAYPSRGLEIDIGNTVNHIPLLGGESVDITARSVTGSCELDLTAAQEVTFMGYVTANTTQSIGFTHGTAAGNIVLLHAPAVQLINPTKTDINGKRLQKYDLRFVPSSGNDEIRIVTK